MAPGTGDLLTVNDLTVSYAGTHTPAVRDISFQVRDGERVGVVGESGSGKTTLALAVSDLLPSAAAIRRGSVTLQGTDCSTLSARALRGIRGSVIGRVPQDPLAGLNPVLTVRTQLRDAIRAHRSLPKGAERQEIVDVLQAVAIPDIDAKLRLYPHELSGGMRQRVLIAMALVNHPALLVADEPTTALDATIQAQILSIIRRASLDRNMALILVSHNINVVASVCDRIIVMYRGEIVEDAPSDTMYRSPLHPYTKVLIEASKSHPLDHTAIDIDGGEPSTGCQYRSLCPHPVSQCNREHPLLESLGSGRYIRCFAVTSATTSTSEEGPSSLVAQGAPGREPAGGRSAEPGRAGPSGGDGTPTRAQQEPVLVAENLVKLYKPRGRSRRQPLRAVDGVSLECWSGGTIGIVGESGCGKTTLGRIISGLIEPTSGKVSIASGGQAAPTPLGPRRGAVQMVFQDPSESLDPHIRIAESVKEPILKGHGSSLPDRVDAALSAVGLDPKLGHHLPHQLSGGQQQRACIARAIIAKPSVVVLDEAVSSLDAILRNEILRLLIQLQRESNLSYIFISHDMTAVLAVSDRVVVMYLGRIVESVGREALTKDGFAHPYSVLLESAQPRPGSAGDLPELLVRTNGELPALAVRVTGCRFSNRCPLADDQCRAEEPELSQYGADHFAACYHAGELRQDAS
jgi:peptide/nickel transport system ATP-binding protein